MKKILLLVFVLISRYGYSQSLEAYPDTFSVLQANIDTFYVTNTDSISAGDSVCISLIDNGVRFAVLNCTAIIYHPDSFVTGRDTCRYTLCDTAGRCDTTMIVIYVDTNRALLPIAYYMNPNQGVTFSNSGNCNFIYGNDEFGPYMLFNGSILADSVLWKLSCGDSIRFFKTDTISFQPIALWSQFPCDGVPGNEGMSICITAYNSYGENTYCDTTCFFRVEGITEVPLFNIRIYPNPADRVLTIDMGKNNDPISSDYSTIILYNSLGQKVKSIPHSSKVVEISVSDLPDGIYVATITNQDGQEHMLGKFVVLK